MLLLRQNFIKFRFGNFEMYCNKGVRSRQEYINCFHLLTFSLLKTNGSEILESHFEIFLMCTQSNP